MPTAIRATASGLVLVRLAEGVLLGVVYYFAGVPSAVLWADAVVAIIPFGAPLASPCVRALLPANGHTGPAAAVGAAGMAVLFIAYHSVRPTIIGNATKLPFLAMLFGILGGV